MTTAACKNSRAAYPAVQRCSAVNVMPRGSKWPKVRCTYFRTQSWYYLHFWNCRDESWLPHSGCDFYKPGKQFSETRPRFQLFSCLLPRVLHMARSRLHFFDYMYIRPQSRSFLSLLLCVWSPTWGPRVVVNGP